MLDSTMCTPHSVSIGTRSHVHVKNGVEVKASNVDEGTVVETNVLLIEDLFISFRLTQGLRCHL